MAKQYTVLPSSYALQQKEFLKLKRNEFLDFKHIAKLSV